MDKELIKKYGLEEAIKRVKAIDDYNPKTGLIMEYIYETYDEADDPNAAAGADPMDGGDPNAAAGADPMAGGDPNAAAGADPMAGGDPNAAAGADPMAGGDPNAAAGADPMAGGEPNGEGMPSEEPMMDDTGNMGDEEGMGEPMQDGDEVIDVDDLTQSQEETEYKIDGVDDKLAKLMMVIDKFEKVIDNQDAKIAELKDEFEKRNPTPTERLNLRSQAGYPFNVQPKEYWDKVAEKEPQYDIDFNNEDNTKSADREEYVLRKGDLKDGNDRGIADTFNMPRKLSDYLSY